VFLWKFKQTGSYPTLLDTSIAYISVLTTFIFCGFPMNLSVLSRRLFQQRVVHAKLPIVSRILFFKLFISILSDVKTGLHDTNYRETVNQRWILVHTMKVPICISNIITTFDFSTLYTTMLILSWKKTKFKEIVLKFVHRLNSYVDSKATQTDYSVPRLK
jgi:hypothetical protein